MHTFTNYWFKGIMYIIKAIRVVSEYDFNIMVQEAAIKTLHVTLITRNRLTCF